MQVFYLFICKGGSGTPDFITTFGRDRNISYTVSFDDISTITPEYSGFTNVVS